MKKHTLLILTLLFVFKTGYGQTNVYHPFPDSNAVWMSGCNGLSVGGGCACQGMPCIFISATQDSLGGDTMIGSYKYYKLWEESTNTLWVDGPPTCPPGVNNYNTTFYNYVYDGAIRQNISLRKVYYMPPLTTHDTLLYNFNLHLGDTLPATFINAANYAYVSKVDSFLITGNYHKRFWLWLVGSTPPTSSDSGYAAIIEGMGSTNGLFTVGPELVFEYSCALNCIKINEVSIYPTATTTCTSLHLAGIKPIENKVLFSISPNPSNGSVQVTHTGNIDELKVTDMLGQLVYEAKPHITNTTLTLANAGVYFITLTSGTATSTKKVIVTK
ncbi:MAG TPA: T9SS type A sorting domain-containing protein [Bacteroidia bacterium]